MFAADGDDSFVFVVSERWAFTGGTDGDDAVGAGFDVEVDESAEHGFVERPVG